MGDEEVGEIRFLTIDSNLTTTTAPIVLPPDSLVPVNSSDRARRTTLLLVHTGNYNANKIEPP